MLFEVFKAKLAMLANIGRMHVKLQVFLLNPPPSAHICLADKANKPYLILLCLSSAFCPSINIWLRLVNAFAASTETKCTKRDILLL